jgi:hypothetical protein
MLDWTSVRPVLEATYDLLDEHDDVDGSDVCRALGRDPDDRTTMRELGLLREHGLIKAYLAAGPSMTLIQPTPEGLQRMRSWPRPGDIGSEAVEMLLAVLDQQIAAAADEEERSRWKRLRDTAASVGQTVVAEMLAAWAARMSGAAG